MQNTSAGFVQQLKHTDSVLFQPEGFGPTKAVPGSLTKVKVLRQRAELGLPLWHRDDCIDGPALTASMRWAKKRLVMDGD